MRILIITLIACTFFVFTGCKEDKILRLVENEIVDSDNDGVVDDKDKCPNTETGVAVDENGCKKDASKDTDGDGVTDDKDKCPDTPKGEAVNEEGCSESQKDDDGDGVPNGKDKCPNTETGVTVDENGCKKDESKDADGDGVADDKDKCPDTPKGEAVNEEGCSESQKDDDGDGVPNGKDKCPNTETGVAVDENGCKKDESKDTDGDGVTDDKDKCPDTPKGEAVNEEGCSDSQKDDDGDGVPNGKDKCPNTETGVAVDENGCKKDASKDTDGDGVADDKDKCPNEAGTADNMGCPALEASKIISPYQRQACIELPIEVKWEVAKGGIASGNEYRVKVSILGESKTYESAWQKETTLLLQEADILRNKVHVLVVEVRNTDLNKTAQYEEVKFHVRGEGEVYDVPNPSAWITPVVSGGNAPTIIEWSNVEGLVYDIYINDELVKENATETKYVHQLSAGTYEAKVIAKNEKGNASVSKITFVVP